MITTNHNKSSNLQVGTKYDLIDGEIFELHWRNYLNFKSWCKSWFQMWAWPQIWILLFPPCLLLCFLNKQIRFLANFSCLFAFELKKRVKRSDISLIPINQLIIGKDNKSKHTKNLLYFKETCYLICLSLFTLHFSFPCTIQRANLAQSRESAFVLI